MGGEKHGLAAIADPTHQFPDRTSCLWVKACRQLIEKHDLRVVDQSQGDKQTLLLAT